MTGVPLKDNFFELLLIKRLFALKARKHFNLAFRKNELQNIYYLLLYSSLIDYYNRRNHGSANILDELRRPTPRPGALLVVSCLSWYLNHTQSHTFR